MTRPTAAATGNSHIRWFYGAWTSYSVQYALQASTAPVAVSRYELPEDVRASLPADEALIAVGRNITLHWLAEGKIDAEGK